MGGWKNKNVLVTGGSGFIGSRLVHALIKAGAKVNITTSTSVAPWRMSDMVRQYAQFVLLLPDTSVFADILKRTKPEVIFHLAGGLPYSGKTPEEFETINAEATKALYQNAVLAGATHFLTLGSVTEYGALTGALEESAEPSPESPYGKSKFHATMYLKEKVSIRTTVLRPCAVYGPVQSFGMFISDCIRACVEKTRFAMSQGEQKIDFLYIDDLVSALLSAGLRNKGEFFEILNVGPGEPVPVRDVACKIAEKLDARECLDIGGRPYRSNEPYTRYLAVDKARTILDWEPRTTLENGIKKTVEWYRTNQNSFSLLTERP